MSGYAITRRLIRCSPATPIRAADLLVTGPDVGWTAFDSPLRVIFSTVVLKACRPALIVPAGSDGLDVGVVVVAWKDPR